MRNASTTAVPSHSFRSMLLALAWSFIVSRRRKDVDRGGGALYAAHAPAAALAGIAVLILLVLAIDAVLIIYLPGVVHLVVE